MITHTNNVLSMYREMFRGLQITNVQYYYITYECSLLRVEDQAVLISFT